MWVCARNISRYPDTTFRVPQTRPDTDAPEVNNTLKVRVDSARAGVGADRHVGKPLDDVVLVAVSNIVLVEDICNR